MRVEDMTDTDTYFLPISTMAATTQEIQGNNVLHQELCGQHHQEMLHHQNLEGLPFDGGGIRQGLLQRRQLKEMKEDFNETMTGLPMRDSSVKRTKRWEMIDTNKR